MPGLGTPPAATLRLYDPRFIDAARVAEAVLEQADARAASLLSSVTASAMLSDKVLRLLDVLCAAASAGAPGWRAIVFCERRATAHALAHMMSCSPGAPPALLRVGAQSGYACADPSAQREALATLAAFRSGLLNVLCATSVLEEGVDVPECALVVLFDLRKNVKSFIQARGRARAAASQLVVLAPFGGTQEGILEEVAAAETGMRNAAHARTSAIAAGMEDEAMDEGVVSADDWAARANGPQCYTVASTGAKVTLRDAVALLHHYVAKLPHDAYCASWKAVFVLTQAQAPLFCAAATLPGHVWFGGASSGPQDSKRAAFAAAALEAISQLHLHGALDDHLVPSASAEPSERGSDSDAEMRDAGGEDGSGFDGEAGAPGCASSLRLVEKEPDALRRSCASALTSDGAAGEWWVYALARSAVAAGSAQHPVAPTPLALLCRDPLPALPPLTLLREGGGAPEQLRLEARGTLTLAAGSAQEAALRAFTDWASATFFDSHPGYGILSPLVVPLAQDSTIDWQIMAAVPADAAAAPAALAAVGDAVGQLVSTQHTDMPRQFFGLQLRPDITLNSPLDVEAADSVTLAHHFENVHGIARSVLDGVPWVEALAAPFKPRKLVPIAGSASPSGPASRSKRAVLLPLPLLHRRCVPSSLHRALSHAPAALWRLRGLLLARELMVKLLPHEECAEDDHALLLTFASAITAGAAGEETSYERLEILGDGWLKWASGCCVFLSRPCAHEGQLSMLRSSLVSNRTLARRSVAAGLHLYARTRAFGRAEEVTVRGKALADVLEAILGAVVLMRGQERAWTVAHSLQVLPCSAPPLASYIAAMERLCSDAATAAASAAAGDACMRSCDDVSLAALCQLEQSLGHTFAGGVPAKGRLGRLALLDEALTHASACLGGTAAIGAPAFQRLEFLGDAALDWLVLKHLYKTRGVAPAGVLSRLRSAALNNERLSARAVTLRLACHLRHASFALHREIVAYSNSDPAAFSAFGDGSQVAPKTLADVAEAVCGAVLLDAQMDVDALWHVAQRILALDDHQVSQLNHPVSALLELCAQMGVSCVFEAAAQTMEEAVEAADDRRYCVRVLVDNAEVARAHGASRRAARLGAAILAQAKPMAVLATIRGAE